MHGCLVIYVYLPTASFTQLDLLPVSILLGYPVKVINYLSVSKLASSVQNRVAILNRL